MIWRKRRSRTQDSFPDWLSAFSSVPCDRPRHCVDPHVVGDDDAQPDVGRASIQIVALRIG